MEEDLEFSKNSEIDATESTTFYKVASDAMEDLKFISVLANSLMGFQIFKTLI